MAQPPPADNSFYRWFFGESGRTSTVQRQLLDDKAGQQREQNMEHDRGGPHREPPWRDSWHWRTLICALSPPSGFVTLQLPDGTEKQAIPCSFFALGVLFCPVGIR